ncbi:MAG: hypothetical protein PVI97_09990, partial [Candidatus Thiodiazotropha sp.]
MAISVIKKSTIIVLLISLVAISSANSEDLENIQLPELGSPSDQYLTPSEEARLGREFMQSVRK